MSGKQLPRKPLPTSLQDKRFQNSVAERLDRLAGLRGGRVAPLPGSATTADCIAKINELIELLQG